MNGIVIYPAAFHGETRIHHPAMDGVEAAAHTPLEDLRAASMRMGEALIRVRDVVDGLTADHERIAEQAACLGYLSESLSNRMGDLSREAEQFVSFVAR